jgi:hypothetical protein
MWTQDPHRPIAIYRLAPDLVAQCPGRRLPWVDSETQDDELMLRQRPRVWCRAEHRRQDNVCVEESPRPQDLVFCRPLLPPEIRHQVRHCHE